MGAPDALRDRQDDAMALTLEHVTVDARDAAALATFWAAALGWGVAPDATAQFAMIGGPARPRDTPGWLFFQVPEAKTAKNRMHVDLQADDLEAETERLVGLGATVLHEKQEWGAHWRTLADPEGNEFCVVARSEPSSDAQSDAQPDAADGG
jgi:predicted enzyme related to lactoylglutathione lyase